MTAIIMMKYEGGIYIKYLTPRDYFGTFIFLLQTVNITYQRKK